MNRKSANPKRSNSRGSRPRLTVDISPSLKRRIKIAAASQEMPISVYVMRVLELAVPSSDFLIKPSDGSITSETLSRADALRSQQAAPFPEDSADLIREDRENRYREL
jgi:hypothetical protein